MSIAFIADLHLTPQRPHSQQLFIDFVQRTRGRFAQLYILGDLFEYWVGDDASARLGYTAVEGALGEWVRGGTEVFFLPGNRDFLVGAAFAERCGCTLLADPYVIEATVGATRQRVLLTHGDALCTDDVAHQAARRSLLSAKWQRAFQHQSIDDRIAYADDLRAQSERDKQAKSMQVMDVNQGAVEACMREHAVWLMIHGHTHRPAVHEFKLDGKPARRYVLGDWYTQDSVLYLDHNGLRLC